MEQNGINEIRIGRVLKMDWLNIHRSTLAAEQFLGCEPVQRATWLCLMAYCADQENGGRIEGAAEWGDRKWQQVVRVTKGEVSESCPLWSWDGGAVVVWAYPVEKEAEVRRNRENGGKGGRPPKPAGNQVVTSGLTQIETQEEPTAPISAETEEERKGKERKEKGRGRESNADDCLLIYEAYPKKVERPEALKEIAAALKIIAHADLLAAVKAYATAVSGWPEEERKFVPSCGRWMKKQKWLDDRAEWSKQKPQSQKPEWALRKIAELQTKLDQAQRQLNRDITDKGADSFSANLSRQAVEAIKAEMRAL